MKARNLVLGMVLAANVLTAQVITKRTSSWYWDNFS